MTLLRLLTLLLVAAFWWQGERFLAANGPTFDEPVHFAAGYSYWATGDFRLNLEDPPLAKLLWALPQFLFDPLPFPDEWRTANEWRVGHAMLFDSGHDWKALLTPARRVNMLFGVGVVVLVGVFARRLTGSRASGVVASALAAFDPNLLAHSCVLSTDASLTFCTLLTVWLAWEVIGTPVRRDTEGSASADALPFVSRRTRIHLLGVAVGLTLGAKFSAVLVVGALGVGLIAVIAGGTVVAMPGAAVKGNERFGGRFRLALPAVMRVTLIALVTLLPLYFVIRFPTWGEGLKYQLMRGDSADTSFFMCGEISNRGWLWYFAVALAVKLPVGVLVLALASLVPLTLSIVGIWKKPHPPAPSPFRRGGVQQDIAAAVPPSESGTNRVSPERFPLEHPLSGTGRGPGGGVFGTGLFVTIFALTLFLAFSLSRVDLGVRVVLPMLPFVYLLASTVVARAETWRYAVAAFAVTSVIVSALRTGPYPLSYVNEFVGGPAGGVRVLGDSNLDWGQGLPAVKEYIDREGLDVVYLSYSGTAPPRAFGIRYQALPGNGQLEPPSTDTVPANSARHVLFVSASSLQGTYLRNPDTFAWLRTRPQTAILAGCIWVFDLTGDPDAIRRVREME